MPPATTRAFRVLLIDDDPLFARSAARLLELVGHKATVTNTASEALHALFSATFDVVISDYDLAEPLNGEQLLDLVGARWPRVYRVLCSGHVHAAAAAQSMLQKPITMSELTSVLDAVAR